jgi:hypothetical protein
MILLQRLVLTMPRAAPLGAHAGQILSLQRKDIPG